MSRPSKELETHDQHSEFAATVCVAANASSATGQCWTAPVATERLARVGYDYVGLDAQHGLIGYSGMLTGLMAIDAGARLRRPGPGRGERPDTASAGLWTRAPPASSCR